MKTQHTISGTSAATCQLMEPHYNDNNSNDDNNNDDNNNYDNINNNTYSSDDNNNTYNYDISSDDDNTKNKPPFNILQYAVCLSSDFQPLQQNRSISEAAKQVSAPLYGKKGWVVSWGESN